MKTSELDGADLLRRIVMNMDSTMESFNDGRTAQQLVMIGRMCLESEWDFLPDVWTTRQVQEALKGMAPRWDKNEKPVYPGTKVKL